MTQKFSAEELCRCNGEGGAPIYISVMGVVYDCSTAANFYGSGGSYHIFAGKEVSRCLAKMHLNDAEANAGWGNLTEEHQESLEEWAAKFKAKYPVVGYFAPDELFEKRGANMEP